MLPPPRTIHLCSVIVDICRWCREAPDLSSMMPHAVGAAQSCKAELRVVFSSDGTGDGTSRRIMFPAPIKWVLLVLLENYCFKFLS